LGRVDYGVSPGEGGGRLVRRSLYVVEDIAAGASLTEVNVRSIRPGFGMLPKHLPDVLGRIATRHLKRGEPLDWSMIGPESAR